MGDLTGQKYDIFLEYASFVRICLRMYEKITTFARFFAKQKENDQT